jgi:hypothetical protein
MTESTHRAKVFHAAADRAKYLTKQLQSQAISERLGHRASYAWMTSTKQTLIDIAQILCGLDEPYSPTNDQLDE